MKILNDWTVGGSLLLIGAGFFSTRFSDVLAYRLGSIPQQLPLLGGTDVTVGRVMGLVPLTMGLGVLLGKMRKTPLVDRVVDLPVVSNMAGFVQDLGDDMKVVIGPGSESMAAEGGPAAMDGASPESYTPQATASPDGYDVSDAGTETASESFAAEIDEAALEKRFTTKRVSRKPKNKMSTDTSKPKGKDEPWRMSKRAEGASSWSGAVGMARKDLGITGFEPIRKGSALYNRAKELYNKK